MNTKHDLYEDGDENIPDVICDSNGQVVLGLCKVCGLAECELDESPECLSFGEVIVERCRCPYPNCKTYHLKGIGTFYQGSGFTLAEAKLIARLLNDYRNDVLCNKKTF